MAKKERITITRDDDLDAIDLELEQALEQLNGANEKITSLLASIESTNNASETKAYAEEGPEEETSGETPPPSQDNPAPASPAS
ncbi:MAG: hypothetical protein IT364_02480 [Candidatus Hydrogenedentes bacterium]|nr:hypothetical protein [Candidatus Hydrogenedentota bacterium]